MTDADDGLAIGEVAARTHLSVHTLRFYERKQLFTRPIQRDAAGRRIYTDDDVVWIQICNSLRAAGMPLADIRRYAELVGQGPGNETQRLALLRRQRELITNELGTLNECLQLIDYKLGIYEQRLADGTASKLWTADAVAANE